jgi:hypothetical protein
MLHGHLPLACPSMVFTDDDHRDGDDGCCEDRRLFLCLFVGQGALRVILAALNGMSRTRVPLAGDRDADSGGRDSRFVPLSLPILAAERLAK